MVMKRLLIMVAILLTAVTAQAQVVAHHAETYEEETGRLAFKLWASARGNCRQEMPRDDGTTMTVIFRTDSAKFYLIDATKKMVISFSRSQAGQGKLWGIEAMETASRSYDKKFLGRETVEGYDCAHNSIRQTSANKAGIKEGVTTEEWFYEPYKLAIRSTDLARGRGYWIMRNITIGEPPAHLFEIPKDYKEMTIPMGGLLEMATGKTESDLKPAWDKANQDAKSQVDKVNSISNDKSKTQEQKIQEMSKLLEGVLGGGNK
jgi:hypothetical protein